MVREWNPPARDPTSSDVVRRSTTVGSTPANASSPASIIPAGPLPTTITSVTAIAFPHPTAHDVASYCAPQGLRQAPLCAIS